MGDHESQTGPIPGSGLGPAGEMADCFLIRAQVPVHHIDFVCRLFEGHEDLGIVRTEEGTSDILQVWAPRGSLADAIELVGRLEADGLAIRLGDAIPMTEDWLKSQSW